MFICSICFRRFSFGFGFEVYISGSLLFVVLGIFFSFILAFILIQFCSVFRLQCFGFDYYTPLFGFLFLEFVYFIILLVSEFGFRFIFILLVSFLVRVLSSAVFVLFIFTSIFSMICLVSMLTVRGGHLNLAFIFLSRNYADGTGGPDPP